MNIRRIIHNYLFDRRLKASKKHFRKVHLREVDAMCKSSGIVLQNCPGEAEFLKKWSPLANNISLEFYRFYSHFLGSDPNILPDDLYHSIIDPLLNDRTSLAVYTNKNMYEKIADEKIFPICILRNINGDYMTRDYKDIMMSDEIFSELVLNNEYLISQGRFIIKPAVDTGQGFGVRLFEYKEGKWVSDDDKSLSLSFLNEYYKSDFIIQECVEPSAFVKQFNPSSYNTCRIITYRSVRDGQIYFLGGLLRIGEAGSFKDNVSAGGFAIPIMQDGTLAKYATNKSRKRYEIVNGINLAEEVNIIPNFDKVLSMAFCAAQNNPLNRVISFDIILDKYNEPHIIEINLRCQTITTIQTTYKTFFGEYTDEIIEYCASKLRKGRYMTFTSYYKKY